MAHFPRYAEGCKELYKREKGYTDKVICCILENQIEKSVSGAKSCLSIGAGPGDCEVEFLRVLVPGLPCYHGVEPVPKHIASLHENIGQLVVNKEGFESHFSMVSGDNYTGPGQEVDVILLFHMLFYIHDPEDLLRKCHLWLAPGWSLLAMVETGSSVQEQVRRVLKPNRTSYKDRPLADMLAALNFQSTLKYGLT